MMMNSLARRVGRLREGEAGVGWSFDPPDKGFSAPPLSYESVSNEASPPIAQVRSRGPKEGSRRPSMNNQSVGEPGDEPSPACRMRARWASSYTRAERGCEHCSGNVGARRTW